MEAPLEVAQEVQAVLPTITASLPEGMQVPSPYHQNLELLGWLADTWDIEVETESEDENEI